MNGTTVDPERSTRNTSGGASLGASRIILLLASILLGIGMGLILLSRTFVLIPTDLQRLGVLVGALLNDSAPPSVVVFGNSVVMSGVDARQLSRELNGHPIAWNCATTGQTLAEAFLLTQELPEATQLAIYSISIRAGSQEQAIHPQKYNTLFMYGFRPDDATISVMSRIYGAPVTEILTRSTLAEVFASRWALRQLIDTQARRLLRSSLHLDRATYDLFHPQTYDMPIASAVTAKLLEGQSENLDQDAPAVAATSGPLARAILDEARTRGRRIAFLFPPIHPEIMRRHGPAIRSAVSGFERSLDDFPEAVFIDAMSLLGDQDFIDDMHPTNAGASLLTRRIAEQITRP